MKKNNRIAAATPRLTVLAYCVGVAMMQLSTAAVADSAVGQNTMLGNALNPASVNPLEKHSDGLRDPDWEMTADRSPSGQLYETPYLSDEPNEEKTATVHGSVEAGVLGTWGDKNNALFRKYKDLSNGGIINNFSLEYEAPDQARFLEAIGGGVGRDDQFYGLQFGRYNDWKVKVFYNETPHVFTTTAYPLYSGIGTGNLTLPSNIPMAGGAACATAACTTFNSTSYGLTGGTQAAVNTAVGRRIAATLAATPATELSLERKQGGIGLDMRLTDNWKLFAAATTEKREGARPFAAVQGGGGGTSPIELAEPIDYTTSDLRAGVRYADAVTNFNFTANANFFRNHISELVFQNPFLAAGNTAGVLDLQGRFDLYPNNDYFNLKGEFARAVPDLMNGRFTATVSLATMRQNDDLLPPTINGDTAGSAAAANQINLNQWNTTAALSQTSANARIDTKLIDLGYTFQPAKDLDMKAKARFYESDNRTNYLACNPNATLASIQVLAPTAALFNYQGCNGVWGRLLNDGSGSALITAVPTAQLIRNIPNDLRQLDLVVGGDYRLTKATSLNGSLERQEQHRTNREREATWENKIKGGYVNRELENATVRLSYEYGQRRGDDYDPAGAYYRFLGMALPTATTIPAATYVLKLADLRKFDLADRNQGILNARVNFMPRDDLDFGISAQFKDANYPDSSYGRKDTLAQNSINLDLTYTPTAERSWSGFYSYQNGRMEQANIQPGAGTGGACNLGTLVGGVPVTAANAQVLCGTAAANISFNPNNWWTENTKDRNHVFGLNFREAIGKNVLELNFTRAMGKTNITYDWGNGPALAPATAANVPKSTDMTTNQNIFEASLRVPVNKSFTAHFLARYEMGSISDFHYTGLNAGNLVMWPAGAPATAANPVGVLMDAGPQSYHTSVIGVLLQYKM
ncbi:hypothetical protein EGT07_26735 [Herbaspirillum sp. HC18]|nr:hypothetical protein EGT07_26735 [Herbaspirillum sp. HC18]